MSISSPPRSGFDHLELAPPLLDALRGLDYDTPTAIQAAAIPDLLAGRDVVARAHTGTGKTAAFALPILSQIDLARPETQALVLVPTRELAIQVAEAFRRYGARLPSLTVLTVYGGQEYGAQIRGLRAGSHVVVGTPGRIMDHMRRGRLDLTALRFVTLDEADEMLAMGFVDDIEWILQNAPDGRQTMLFSATMPPRIREIASRYLTEPREVSVRQSTATAITIRQRYCVAGPEHKLDVLCRILEVEATDGVLVFAKTKAGTTKLVDALTGRGFTCAALNGDVPQHLREETVERLKRGQLDILVATDVAARGLDVDRIRHVINFEMPGSAESYVHRIGRTGRAGRAGDAILFVTPRETRMLRTIERGTGQALTRMAVPTIDEVNERRLSRFADRIATTLTGGDLAPFRAVVERLHEELGADPLDIAAALARLVHGDRPLLLEKNAKGAPPPSYGDLPADDGANGNGHRSGRARAGTNRGRDPREPARGRGPNGAGDARDRGGRGDDGIAYEAFRVEVGRAHGVGPGNLVGAIAGESDLDRRYIGRIEIHDDHSLLDMPVGMPAEILRDLQRVWVMGRQLRMSRVTSPRAPRRPERGHRPPARRVPRDPHPASRVR
jgi:ATP-dependent RNA helicase DeaD